MIRGLKLHNWRSHSESEFVFEKGTNVLVGIVGSGKSSAMDAISFGLFGTFPALSTRKVKLDELIRDGQDEAEVVVDFLDDYSVRRVVERGKGTTNSELRKAGKLIEGNKTAAVTQKVEGILKIDYELFERAIYSEQNQIDYFLRIPKGQRKSKIDQLLGIDQFEDARKGCTKLINDIGKEALGLEKSLEEYEGVGAKERKGLEEKVEEIEKDCDKKKGGYAVAEEKKNAAEKLRNASQKKSDEFLKINSAIQELGKRKGELERVAKTKPAETRAELQKELTSLQKEVKRRDQLLGEYRSGLREGKERAGERKVLEEKLLGFGERNVLKEFEGLEMDLKKSEKDLTRLRARKEFLEKGVGEVEGDSCPMCGRGWDAHLKGEVKVERREELQKVVGEIFEKEKSHTSLEGKFASLQREAGVFETASKRIRELGEPEKAVRELEKQVGDLKTGNDGDEKRVDEIQHSLEVLKSVEELDDVQKGIFEKEKRLVSLDFDKKGFERIKKEYESMVLECNRVKEELVRTWTTRDNLKAELKRFEEWEKEIGELGKKLAKMKSGEEFLTKFKNALFGVQDELRQEFVKNLNDTMSELWEDIYPYGDFSDVRLGVLDGDYVLQLRKGEWVDVEGIVSGGERSTAALALRIGFALALAPHLKVLILDEPTHNLDARGIQELGNVLRERIQDYVSQVFLITHEERLEGAVSGSLYRLERDKGRKEASKVSLVEAI